MRATLRRNKGSNKNVKSNKSFDQRKWVRGFSVAAILTWIFYAFIYDILPDIVQSFFQKWFPVSSANESMVWIICALGLNIVVGYAGLLDLGFVAFWAIGGYTAGWFMSDMFHQTNFHFASVAPLTINGIHISFWIVLLIGAAIAALFGVLIGAPTLRLKSDYLALVTLGFGEIIPQFIKNGENIAGFNLTNGSKGISPVDQIGIFGKKLGPFDDDWKYLILVCLAALMVYISLRIRSGRLGRAWLAIREDELAASMMGVPLMSTKLSAYAVGAMSGGVAGVAYAAYIGTVSADRFDFAISITLLAMVVLGGMGNVWGVILGALAISWVNSKGLPEIGNTINGALGTQINFPSYNFLLFGLVLILMMLFKREGLLPESRLKQILHETDDETSNTGGH
jgi:branched-chain amino acid transport system permease protein